MTDQVDLFIVSIVYCVCSWLGVTVMGENGMNAMENSLPCSRSLVRSCFLFYPKLNFIHSGHVSREKM